MKRPPSDQINQKRKVSRPLPLFFFFHGSLFVIGKSGVSKKTPGVIFDINYSTISVRPSIYQILSPILTFFRACLHGNGGRQVGEVTRLGGVTPCPYYI